MRRAYETPGGRIPRSSGVLEAPCASTGNPHVRSSSNGVAVGPKQPGRLSRILASQFLSTGQVVALSTPGCASLIAISCNPFARSGPAGRLSPAHRTTEFAIRMLPHRSSLSAMQHPSGQAPRSSPSAPVTGLHLAHRHRTFPVTACQPCNRSSHISCSLRSFHPHRELGFSMDRRIGCLSNKASETRHDNYLSITWIIVNIFHKILT
jgi:hypothetical protein